MKLGLGGIDHGRLGRSLSVLRRLSALLLLYLHYSSHLSQHCYGSFDITVDRPNEFVGLLIWMATTRL
jgi:hypothetical protein